MRAPVKRYTCPGLRAHFRRWLAGQFRICVPASLREHQVPATIYLLSDLVGSHYRFWPNALATLLADRRGAATFDRWPAALQREVSAVTGSRAAPLPLGVGEIDAVITRCKHAYSDPGAAGDVGEEANTVAGKQQDRAACAT